MNHERPRQNIFPLNHRSGPMQEQWIRHEGLLVMAIVLILLILAVLEQLVIPYFRH